jgi:trehalose 6-phosphate synthase
VGEDRRRKLIVVSNRGPVSFSRDERGHRVARRGGGGLVTALRGLAPHHDVTWIASAMTSEDAAVAAEAEGQALDEVGRDGSPYRLRLVAHDPDVFDRFYNVVANPALWFLQHRLWELVEGTDVVEGLEDAWQRGYVPVNEAFADAVVAELERQPDAAVFLHDYHLYLVPRLVRERAPGAVLSHFVHIPWPEPEDWMVLPEHMRRAIHDGLLANDVVGFHTQRWRENFVACAEAFCGGPGGVLVTAHPISVDPAEFEELSSSREVLAEERDLEGGRPERVVLRVDRTDPSKNIVRGFRAFERYLDRHPEAQGHVTMYALLDPSRQEIPQYAAYLREIEETVRDVNDRLGRGGWSPIHLEIQDNFPRSVAAYKLYDVLLVNAIFDGLNLVAKEAPLVNERDGVLVLSENTGAHEELGEWALTVDPFDIDGQARAIAEALELPASDRRARAEAIRSYVHEHDLAAWLDAQLADLDTVAAGVRR